MYFYMNEKRQFRMLDGDKIASLVAAFIVDLVRLAGLQNMIRVGIVQTAYANGASTKYSRRCVQDLVHWRCSDWN